MVEVGVIMGSISDWETMKHTCLALEELGIDYEKQVISAHRTPEDMFEYAENARDRGLKVIIAGAGGSRTFTRYGRSKNDFACNRCSC
ncbi:phosphoribosylaminoimidazole carboxylase catalytic subunit [Gracilibacillus boraciitolerans JCM 21714]|uniref:Phosphoribosylaminoimidazole carboxylase catalytic subunit n=1 Tax=Gracilibacillus boraciitolerans JCM 21714 TaxID=1298598 RepID=W4VG19_9BACI|nr:phosphoribosylaminoimidazole carboxylase catalytic subunit [Gracilibacillus boraciitolerans JCM 21714]